MRSLCLPLLVAAAATAGGCRPSCPAEPGTYAQFEFAAGERRFAQVHEGDTTDDVLKLLGAPKECKDGNWRYVAGTMDGPETTIVLTIGPDGKVKAVERSGVGCRYRRRVR